MLSLVAGIVVLIVTFIVLMALRPRGERLYRLANTEWEPYVAVALCAGVALGFTMALSGLIALHG